MTIVTGLPRTRTAWVSAWLDVEHEPLRSRAPDWNLVRAYGDWSGVLVDSGAIMFRKELTELWPNAAWVFLLRPQQDVIASLKALMPDLAPVMDKTVQLLSSKLQECIQASSHKLFINMKDMDSPSIMSHLWSAVSDQPFDAVRFQRFCKLHIEAKEFSRRFIINR